MLKTGVCSVTFRRHGLQGVVDLASQAGLDAIEWGGDVHVPPGDAAAAQEARHLTLDAGLEISSFGSYYSVLDAEGRPQEFGAVMDSAQTLGTGTIRIWPGAQPSETASGTYREKFIEKLRVDLVSAAQRNLRLVLEFHANTLADSNAAMQGLIAELDHPNLFVCWHPVYWLADPAYRFQGLEALADRVLNLHVFHCLFRPFAGTWGENIERRPLAEGFEEWQRYLSVPLTKGDRFALLEFVRNDDPRQFMADAATLRQMLNRMDRDSFPKAGKCSGLETASRGSTLAGSVRREGK